MNRRMRADTSMIVNGWAEIACRMFSDDRPYLFWRSPGSAFCRCVWGRAEGIQICRDLSELNEKKGVVFAPFFCTEDFPALVWRPESETDLPVPCTEELLRADASCRGQYREQILPDASYVACFKAFSDALQTGEFRKIVLARSVRVSRDSGFNLLEAFQAACRQFVYSCVYLYYTPQTGIWVGCTPEILLAGQNGHYLTVALAGTQPLPSGAVKRMVRAEQLLAELSWDDKNRKEQRYVTEYISSCLHQFGVKTTEKGPFTVQAGALAHLKTEIRFELPEDKRVGDLLQTLHPTPAVCGLPKWEAARFIQTHEPVPRGYYSGFIGWLDPDGNTELYVNLRSMQVCDTAFVLYAGGGLLDSSVGREEWLETERKMGAMRYVVARGYS